MNKSFTRNKTRAPRLALACACLAPFGAFAQERENALSSLLAKTAEAPQIQLRDTGAAPAQPTAAATATARPVSREPKAMAGEFFERLSAEKVDEAFNSLTAGSNLAKREKDLTLFRERTRQAMDDYGKIAGHELLEEKQAGANLLRLTYVSLAERYPLRWRLYFYKARDQWEIIDIRVDDNLKALFQEDTTGNRQGLVERRED
jgi:hypothetical protein